MLEDLADVIDGEAGDGDVAAGDAGLGADTLGDCVGPLEEDVQHWPEHAALLGQLVSTLHLSGDLPLADDHAIEAGRDTKQMSHDLWPVMLIQMRPNLHRGKLVKLAQKLGHEIGIGNWLPIAPGKVQLDPVA